jgi:hypothetical protein
VEVGRGATLVWRRVKQAAGNRLTIGDRSIVQANIRFEETGGVARIADVYWKERPCLLSSRRHRGTM